MAEETKNIVDKVDEESDVGTHEEAKSNPLESEIVDLKQQLEAKELEAKNNYDRWLRQTAELDNFKKRTARERDEGIRLANEALIKDLLPVVDNLERAVAHASGGGNGKPLVEGVEMVLRQFLDVLTKHGAVQMLAVGQSFDPAKHEAMTQVESDDHEPNSVVEEHQKGYLFRDRLLRPALVSVAKAPGTKEKKNGQSKVENGPSDD
jgi:molecular chaperone GrpE